MLNVPPPIKGMLMSILEIIHVEIVELSRINGRPPTKFTCNTETYQALRIECNAQFNQQISTVEGLALIHKNDAVIMFKME